MRNILVFSAVIAILIIAGCVSTPGPQPKASQPEVNQINNTTITKPPEARYVQINMVDGGSVGGQYLSETAAFVTIIPMYLLEEHTYGNGTGTCDFFETDPEYLTKGSGVATGIKVSLVNTMVDIPDPRPYIAEKSKSQEETAAALDQKCAAQLEAYRIAKEKREAEAAKYAGKPP